MLYKRAANLKPPSLKPKGRAHDLEDRVLFNRAFEQMRLWPCGTRDDIIRRPKHAYTQRLLAAVPEADPRRPRQKLRLEGAKM